MDHIFKGTPGPWKKGNGYGSVVACSIPDDALMSRAELPHQDSYGGYLIAESIENKNADLIAAAPDLLEALLHILPHALVTINENHPAHKKASIAIHKALNITQFTWKSQVQL